MNIVPVYPSFPVFHVHCSQCGRPESNEREGRLYADLDGPAFRSYYCAACARKAQPDAWAARIVNGEE
jgi:hypothetical protein